MLRLPIVIIGLGLLLAACTKSNNANKETALLGVWVNSNAPLDTLWFINKGGKNILRYNNSFNTAMRAYTEQEYFLTNGKLSIALGGPSGVNHAIQSFTWKQENRQFDILIHELYLFISSSSTHGVYSKI